MKTIMMSGVLAGAILALALPTSAQDSDSNESLQNANEIIMLQSTVDSVGIEEQSNNPKRVCIECNGKYYCIAGGCANTPCGWICSEFDAVIE